jgi:C-terminal processing protease CtpA/Prc
MFRKNIIVCLIAIFIISCRNDIVVKNTPENVFLSFWQTMDENYVYFEEKNLDWDSIFNVYYQKAKIAQSNEFIKIFDEIIQEINDKHVSIVVSASDTIMHLTAKEDSILHNGYQQLEENFSFKRRYYRTSYPFECWQHLEKDYAYIEIVSFSPDNFIMGSKPEDIYIFLDSLKYKNGIIIDIRFNGGGFGNIMYNIAAPFFLKGKHLSFYNVFKTGKKHNDFSEKVPQYFQGKGIVSPNIPVVLLIGNKTYSAGNYFACMLKNLPNCITIGEKTGGGGGAIITKLLPNRWLLSYTWYKSYSTNGHNMEYGLMPDIFVKHNISDKTIDTTLLRAIEVLDSINRF